MNLKSDVIIFTDGSSRGNPGPGGFAAIIIMPQNPNLQPTTNHQQLKVVEIGGREEHTTNNRMELRAAIEALSYLKNLQLTTYNLQLFTDSSYLINGITKWIHGWQKNGWKTKAEQDVENKDLWEALAELTRNLVKSLRSHGAGKNTPARLVRPRRTGGEQARKEIKWRLVAGHTGVVGNARCDEIATAFADGKTPELYSGVLKNYSIKNVLDVESHQHNPSNFSKRKLSRARAYSYVSMVNGVVQTHKTWAECEKRVKGKRGARYKKVFSSNEEQELIAQWRV